MVNQWHNKLRACAAEYRAEKAERERKEGKKKKPVKKKAVGPPKEKKEKKEKAAQKKKKEPAKPSVLADKEVRDLLFRYAETSKDRKELTEEFKENVKGKDPNTYKMHAKATSNSWGYNQQRKGRTIKGL